MRWYPILRPVKNEVCLAYPEGWDGEGGVRGVQDGGHMFTHGRFMSIYGKNHYNIVK